MSDIQTRIQGRAGRITFTRPKALNAMSYDMCMAIDAALRDWAGNPEVDLVIIDAEGDKAFCAGGDIADIYREGRDGNYAPARRFWQDEYRVNAYIDEYPKPVVSFMQGFVMGGGVGIGCHASHRVVEDSTRIAMPECGIGLIPDVGGTYLLARAPGELGKYLGLTAARMGPQEAIHAGFADHYIPRADWAALIAELEASGDAGLVARAASPAPQGKLTGLQSKIDALFRGQDMDSIRDALAADTSPFAHETLATLDRNSPISMACTAEVIRRLRADGLSLRAALEQELRYVWRSQEHSDLLEGIRAQIIDKDRNPRWQYTGAPVPQAVVDALLAPLTEGGLSFYNTEG